MSQDLESFVLWKHESKPRNPWSSENMSQDLEPLVLWKLEPKPKKSLVLRKHEPRSRTLGPLKCMTRISISSWPQVSVLYSFKEFFFFFFACMNYVWTWSSHQEVRRQSPSRFSPNFDPLHDDLHFYLHASYIHHG